MPEWTVQNVFEADGLLSSKLEGYETRMPQFRMAMGVQVAIAEHSHLAAEAPCGVGKSLAYLVPAISQVLINKGREDLDQDDNRVVVATANIALQEQLAYKDLPFLAEALPDEFEFALVKGRNNYLCRDSLETFRLDKAQGTLALGEDASGVPFESLYQVMTETEKVICQWSSKTQTGDKSELEIVPQDETWRQFAVTAEECLGSSCPNSDECFANAARKALQHMDVIVVNYHMLFAALRVRMETTKNIVLPPFKYLICDEAHKVPDIARDFFGWNISKWVVNRIVNRFNKGIRQASRLGLSQEDARAYTSTREDAVLGMDRLWVSMGEFYGDAKGSVRILHAETLKSAGLSQAMTEISTGLADMSRMAFDKRNKADLKKHGERAAVVASQLREAASLDDVEGVYFLERFGKNRQLRLVKRLLEVGDLLWDQMFSHTKSTVITSATLAVDKKFKYIRHEIGMKEGGEVIVESPFDFRKQACIVLSAKAPDPKQRDYPERVAKIMKVIIEQAGGRTLGLFTSYRVLNHAAEYLRAELPAYHFLVQGEAPRMKLVKDFKEDIESVLLGTESFWAGVDVPGKALSCLVIDKIPFPSPGDPVLDALSDRANDQSPGSGFWQVSVPRAVLQLRQGCGRLIRRKDDRGVIVILDNRLVTKGYGADFVSSLPRMTRAKGIRDGQVERWLAMEG